MPNQRPINPFPFILSAVIFLACLAGPSIATATDKQVKMMQPSGGLVAATPISIPKPVRLVKIAPAQLPDKTQPNQHLLKAVAGMPTARISDCTLKSVISNEMVFELSYRIPSSLEGPFYGGAFIYESRQQAVNAGYKPLQLTRLPEGTADLTLVLPASAFTSSYIETFLIRSGKILTKTQFKLPFEWNGTTGKLKTRIQPGYVREKTVSPKPRASFCEDYANAAVAQFHLGMKHRLPGIAAPVWSNDQKGHYSWCLQVSDNLAIREDTRRQNHLKKYLHSDLNAATINEPIPGLDPGRGP